MKRIILSIALITTLLSCKKDVDDQPKPDNPSNNTKENLDLHVKDFIWKGLNTYYLWQADVPNLANNRFASTIALTNFANSAYVDFLKSFSNNEVFFYNLLNKPSKLHQAGYIDRFSYIVDDYTEIEKHLQGISLSSGMDFILVQYGGGSNVLGLVRYVLPNSEAEKKGVKRGNIFLSVDGTLLTINNYASLLFNDKTSMTIDIARLERQNNQLNLVSENRTISMAKSEITENPILVKKVIVKEDKKIGYLMYNGFVANFDVELNKVFAEFKAEGVTDLVLDLRYNGGGRVSSAVYLSSMILGSDVNGKLFAKERWNDKLQSIVEEKRGGANNVFTNTLVTDKGGTFPINHLNMSKVYVLTTGRTASASELVINGLKPYIDVIQIGTNTTGKNVGSITIYDYDDKGAKNPNHKWAMQPLTFKIENATGFGDYTNGLPPTYEIQEDLANMGVLGDEGEPFLAKAIQLITNQSGKYLPRKVEFPVVPIADSKSFNYAANGMYK